MPLSTKAANELEHGAQPPGLLETSVLSDETAVARGIELSSLVPGTDSRIYALPVRTREAHHGPALATPEAKADRCNRDRSR